MPESKFAWMRTLCAISAAAAAIGAAGRAHALDKFWNNPNGGNWSIAANWTPLGMPGSSDHAHIELGGNYTVTLDTDTQVQRLTLGGTAVAGTQILDATNHNLLIGLFSGGPNVITASGFLVLRSSGVAAINDPIANFGEVLCSHGTSTLGLFTNEASGVLRIQSGVDAATLNSTFTNNGLVELTYSTGPVNSSTLAGGIINNGVVDVLDIGPGPVIRNLNGTLNNHGEINIFAPCTINAPNADHINQLTGEITINAPGADVNITRSGGTPSFTNHGTIDVIAGDVTFEGGGTGLTFINNGTITIADDAFAIQEGVSTNAGTLTVASGALFTKSIGTWNQSAPSISGGGIVTFTNSTLNFTVNYTGGSHSLFFNNCTANGPGSITVPTQLQFNNSVINTDVINPSGRVLRLSGGGYTAELTDSLTNQGNFIIENTNGAGITAILPPFTNQGSITLTTANTPGSVTMIVSHDELIMAPGSTLNVNLGAGGSRTIDADFSNLGQININTDCLVTVPNNVVPSNGGGGVINLAGGDLTIQTSTGSIPPVFENLSVLSVGAGHTFSLLGTAPTEINNYYPTGVLKGSGTIVANLVRNSWNIAPGFSPGQLSLAGNLVQQSKGKLTIEIAGPAASGPGVTFDHLNLTGNVTLGEGKLSVLLSGYSPPIGQAYDILTANSVIKHFAVAELPSFPDERFMKVEYPPQNLAGGGASVTVTVQALTSVPNFDDAQTVPLFGDPADGVFGDFDNDNDLDLALAMTAGPKNPGAVVILFNDTGQFSNSMEYAVGVDPSAITTGFFDDDEGLDLAVTNRGDGTVTVLMNSGSGVIGALPPIFVGNGPVAIKSADFDGAALAGSGAGTDLVIVNKDDNEARMLINQGDGGGGVQFLLSPPIPAGDEPIRIDPADVDNDRDFDLVIINSADDKIGVYHNDGGARFGAATLYDVGNNPSAIVVGQLNNDPHVDIAVANKDDGTISVLVNSGEDGEFAQASSLPVNTQPRSLALAAPDLDGDVDIVVIGDDAQGNPVAQLLRNDSTGATVQLAGAQSPPIDEGAIVVLAGNLDGQANGDDLVTINKAVSSLAGSGGGDDGNLSVVINGAAAPCPADVGGGGGGDQTVNVIDLLAVIAAWGPCAVPVNCPADINDDGAVNVIDLLTIISGWGPCK